MWTDFSNLAQLTENILFVSFYIAYGNLHKKYCFDLAHGFFVHTDIVHNTEK